MPAEFVPGAFALVPDGPPDEGLEVEELPVELPVCVWTIEAAQSIRAPQKIRIFMRSLFSSMGANEGFWRSFLFAAAISQAEPAKVISSSRYKTISLRIVADERPIARALVDQMAEIERKIPAVDTVIRLSYEGLARLRATMHGPFGPHG